MKKILLLFTILLFLSGCSSGGGYHLSKPVGEISEPEILALSYDNFDGVKFGDYYPVAAGETLNFQVNVETKSGSLTIYLTPVDDQDTVVYKAENIQTSQFSFTIDEPGEYALYLDANEHQGGYSIKNTRTMNP